MRILIVGSGAMGSRYGVALHRGGAEVVLFDVNKEHTRAISENGLVVHSDGTTSTYKIAATSDISQVGIFDYAFVFTKAIHTVSALETVAPALRASTILVTLQNGMGNIETLRTFSPTSPIIAGTTNYAAALLGPGQLEANGSGITKMQLVAGAAQETADNLARVLEAGGIHVDLVEDIQHYIWAKVAFNAALNTVTALTGLSVGDVGAAPESLEMVFRIAKDVAKVARRTGVDLEDEEVCASIQSVMDPTMSSGHHPSMLQDVIARRKTEIDCICGKVLDAGTATGTETPYLASVYSLIKAIERSYAKRVF